MKNQKEKDLITFLYWCIKHDIDLSFTDDCPEGIAERYIQENDKDKGRPICIDGNNHHSNN